MDGSKHKEHDFGAKLRQTSVIDRLKAYIQWRRDCSRKNERLPIPEFGPLSINLDLTTACNFACPHCVDSGIINTGERLDFATVKASLDTLHSQGLLSVILLGGGEPTLHKDFEKIVRYIKSKNLQLGIVTNGTRLRRVEKVAGLMAEKDWLRISIDAAREETFFKSHRPRGGQTLDEILHNARQVKLKNPKMSLGYSFVIVWEGIEVGGHRLFANIDEIPRAVELAEDFDFDYIAFKPCLLKHGVSQKESLFDPPDAEREKKVIEDIRVNLDRAREMATGRIKILESLNLKALIDRKVHELKRQPQTCHVQCFRTVLSPAGIFHCPAFRGNPKARLGDQNGYLAGEPLQKTFETLTRSVEHFDAENECAVIACFYHHVNWWLEDFIKSDKDVEALEEIVDNDFFL